MAFLRREIARVEGRGSAEPPAPVRRFSASGQRATLDALLSPARLAGNLHEIMSASPPDMFSALGFALRLAAVFAHERGRTGMALVIEDFLVRETGAPYGPGLLEAGVDPARLLIVRTQGPRETLRAMEDALRCKGVGAVVAESAIDARLYSLDVSRRLTLAARAGGGAGFLAPVALAGAGARLSSTAETRVEIARRSSASIPVGGAHLGLPGAPGVRLRILKARGMSGLDSERVHEVAYDAFSLGLSPLSVDRPDQTVGGRAALSA
ncbi:MAG: hypothetical protein KGM42_06575 [Hyphomicrobiales bacterium]|nr:hypothetical protein [Hyphomicrobiales bacterium]